MKRLLALVLLCLSATRAIAHPHIFADTGLAFHFDAEGRLAQVEVTWAYDEFYSLLVTEDMELDQDFDGKLTEAEQARLTGFDMQWIEGFNGDLEIVQGDTDLRLSGPRDYSAVLRDGRIITTHFRDVEGASAENPAYEAKPYDRTYYTAYDVTLPVTVSGREGCRSRVRMPDLTKGLMAVRDQLAELDADTNPDEAGLPNIGEDLASIVIVTCGES
ncbi:polyphosphate kinase [Sulfitobacter alexandrii]|uniref:Polyphosphate kinase n=1 Tax=Sulfitobacter alexandrii TaxID=1917485 RepID=A0A1J0WL88_9RHOB|nr:DUF1007 family protein [Sulfitobacter alexandrii]APE44928.1 polyphosphate kinase [Sulfitobacter alexandrii]